MLSCKINIPAILVLGSLVALSCFAGQPQKWDDVPKAVRDTILAKGGKAGGPVDLESTKIDGKAVYEAAVKDKNGVVQDLVITEDGKLVETKTDDAADKAQERLDRAKKILADAKFSHPRDINNPYLPLATLKQDVLEGKEGSKKVRIERTAKPDVHKTFKIGDKTIDTLAVEDREIEDGKLAEVALDYFAQDDAGRVYYLGEDVDVYENGKIVSHEGSWLFGKDTQSPGIIFPAHPKVGDQFMSEDVSEEIHENDEVVSVTEPVTVPAGTYQNCIKVKELLADGTTEYKFYAKGVGVVCEVPPDGDVVLKSHSTRTAK